MIVEFFTDFSEITFDRVDRVKAVTGQPVLPGDEDLWILGQAFIVGVKDIYSQWYVTIPEGFVTDGASIPPLAQRITGWRPWDEPQRWAAILHDYSYCIRGYDRKVADRSFRAALETAGAGWFKRWAMYAAVRVGGWKAYRADQRSGPITY